MKKAKKYYAVAAYDGVGIYDDYAYVERIQACLKKCGDIEVYSCDSIYEAKRVAIQHYNLFQEAEEQTDALLPLECGLSLNRFLFRREIKEMRGALNEHVNC